MKIAIIRQKFVIYGGAEKFVQGYIHQLAEDGHDIHVFANQWISNYKSNQSNISLDNNSNEYVAFQNIYNNFE